MIFLFSLSEYGWETYAVVAVLVILITVLVAALINKGKYAARYKSFYKKMDKTITKKYNANLLIEDIINTYQHDQSNTYKTLKRKGKKQVKRYFDYFVKTLPELVLLKSYISSDKNKTQIAILLLNENNKVVYRWSKQRKTAGLIKACNKYQMVTSYIAFFYEVGLHINENLPYKFINHDNEYRITYEICKNAKHGKKKIKEKKLTKKQLKSLEKVEKIKTKKEEKLAKKKR